MDYITFLRAVVDANKGQWGYKKQLAACAGCQPAYLSQVLKGSVQLTPEQAEKLSQFWGLNELEGERFFYLVLLGRAGTPSLRKKLETRLAQIRAQWEKSETTYDQPSLQESDRAFFYYANWLYSAIHVLLTIPALQTSRALAEHLKIDQVEVEEALKHLERSGLAIQAADSWRVTQAKIHSPEDSLSAEMHHRNWRLRAIEQGRKKTRVVRYTSAHTLSKSDFLKVRDILDEAIKSARKTIGPSNEEMAACLVIDYFSLGENG